MRFDATMSSNSLKYGMSTVEKKRAFDGKREPNVNFVLKLHHSQAQQQMATHSIGNTHNNPGIIYNFE